MTTFSRHTVFQNSLMSALLDGIYDGEMTIGQILSKGNFGLGTFDGLDGEMIILDGTCYQLRSDGTATIADLEQKSPFAQVTNFVPKIVAVGIALLIAGNWMIAEIIAFTNEMFARIPSLLSG
mgnify:CR=1 FL=1